AGATGSGPRIPGSAVSDQPRSPAFLASAPRTSKMQEISRPPPDRAGRQRRRAAPSPAFSTSWRRARGDRCGAPKPTARGSGGGSAGLRPRAHVERAVELFHRERAALHEAESDRRLAHRDALGDSVLGDLRRVLVADELVERRDDRGRHARERGGALDVRLEALDGLVGEYARA